MDKTEKLKHISSVMEEDLEQAKKDGERQHQLDRAWFASRMNATSLSDWISIATRAAVPFVASEIGGWIERRTLMSMWDGDDEANETLNATWERIRNRVARLEQGGIHMVVRADYASANEIKAACATPGEHRNCLASKQKIAMHHDPRIGELGYLYPRDWIAVHVRPYVEPRMIEGYALEFRVWVKDGRVHAVSSYYPQRPLPDTGEIHELIAEAIVLTERLAAATPEDLVFQGRAPAPGEEPETGRMFTADFIAPAHEEDGPLVYLEGNPYTFPDHGAHPCCFLPRLKDLWKPTPDSGPFIALSQDIEQ